MNSARWPTVFSIVLILSIWINDGCDAQSQCGISSEKLVSRIIGGVSAKPDAWPWMVSLSIYGQHFCGGTLISANFILTAAHCLRDAPMQSVTQSLAAATVYIHPRYEIDAELANDIALIRLSKPLVLTQTSVKTICLPAASSGQLGANVSLMVIGWGLTQEGGYQVSSILQQVVVKTISSTSLLCRNQLTYPNGQLCAGLPAGGKDACQGDSGGPAMSYKNGVWYVEGVVSYGTGCGRANFPGIYTRVSFYLSWINSIMNQPKRRFNARLQEIVDRMLSEDGAAQ